MPAKTSTNHSTLVSDLAAQLRRGLNLDEPYLIQDRIPQTRTRHVVVIWDAWGDLDRPARGKVIADAFQAAKLLNSDRIAVSMGLTQQEALELGYLPYQIIANWKPSDGKKTFQRLRDALENTPGVQVRTGSSLQLRYPTLEYAQEAYRQLTKAVPGPYWTIVREESAALSS